MAGFSTLAAVAIAATVVSAGVAAYGQYQQGQAAEAAGRAEQNAANYRAALARNNAIIAERNAADAIERGRIDSAKKREEANQLKGRQLTALAASGIDVGSGSAVDVLADTSEIGKLEELQIKNNAAREAMGFRQQASNFESDAALGIASGQNAAGAGAFQASSATLQATGTAIGGLGSVASKWYNYKTA